MKISVCIVEDNVQLRSAFEQMITADKHYQLKGSLSNVENALQKPPNDSRVLAVNKLFWARINFRKSLSLNGIGS